VIVDTSALIAILREEPDAEEFRTALAEPGATHCQRRLTCPALR
jgi:uncharacterized protein with PIN domain